MSKRILDPRILIGILISALFLVLAFYGLDLKKVHEELLRIRVVWLVPLVAINILSMLLRSFRWRLFFSGARPRFAAMFSATMIGYMANNVLPARIGEVVRAYVLGRRERISATRSMATIVTERVFDVISVLLVFGLYMLYSMALPAQSRIDIPPFLRIGSAVSLAIGLAALAVMALLRAVPGRISNGVDGTLVFLYRVIQGRAPRPGSVRFRLARFIGESARTRIRRMTLSFIGGLSILGNARDMAEAALWSFVNWGGLILGLVCSFKAFDFQLGFSAGVVLIVFMALGVAVPSGPGSVGPFHYSAMQGLLMLGITSDAKRAAYAIIVHACSYVPVTLIGLGYMVREGVSFRELRARTPDVAVPPGALADTAAADSDQP